jgi:hypothetical protein
MPILTYLVIVRAPIWVFLTKTPKVNFGHPPGETSFKPPVLQVRFSIPMRPSD